MNEKLPVIVWPNIDEINAAAKSTKLMADKWSAVADNFNSILSWNLPVVFVAGAVIGIIIYALLRR
jgi:hypothetical protein